MKTELQHAVHNLTANQTGESGEENGTLASGSASGCEAESG